MTQSNQRERLRERERARVRMHMHMQVHIAHMATVNADAKCGNRRGAWVYEERLSERARSTRAHCKGGAARAGDEVVEVAVVLVGWYLYGTCFYYIERRSV